MYPYGLIGNCQVSALISQLGSLDWLCLPQPDSEPVFGAILDPEKGGRFSIEGGRGLLRCDAQFYIENTPILVTELSDGHGGRIRVTDFCPRFQNKGDLHYPPELIRLIEPLEGTPKIKLSFTPIQGWKQGPAPFQTEQDLSSKQKTRYQIAEGDLILRTNASPDTILHEASFDLEQKLYFSLTWNEASSLPLRNHCELALAETQKYWQNWVKHCSIPTLYQKETIRSAITLKLHCHEESGAILAALTTSLPEAWGETRNWDYRYCWLRDAYFVLQAFHHLGHFEEMEGFLKFLLKILEGHEHSQDRLAPVYRINQALPLPEVTFEHWQGYQKSRPVRLMNQAAEHIQNDIYGELLLALAPIYLDHRFIHLRTAEHDQLFSHLAVLCERAISKPDAGLWEIRNGWQEHTFSNLMSWAGLERVARIQERGHLMSVPLDVPAARRKAMEAVLRSAKERSLRNGPEDSTFDAALTLCASLGFPDSDINMATLNAIQANLQTGATRPASSFYYRYLRNDDFGRPQSAFLICSFWVAQGLARMGRRAEAKAIFEDSLTARNHLGLLSEHYDIQTGTQLGNFPQAYSHVGLILGAFAVSPPWEEIL
jgi:GH15 family glucan-1,4-alpha-glucosidase